MEQKKQPYEPPLISRINIIVKDSLLLICKNIDTGGNKCNLAIGTDRNIDSESS